MRNFLIILITIVSLTFTSCESSSNEIRLVNAETEKAYVFPLGQEYLYEYMQGYYHDVVQGDNLNNLAKKYLGDRKRWGELLTQNNYLSAQADNRDKADPNLKIWTIYPGERIFLPNDAVGAKSLGVNNSIKFLIDEATHEEFIRSIPTEKNMDRIYIGSEKNISKKSETITNEIKNSDNGWSLLSESWNFLGPILGAILLLALVILIIWCLFQLLRYLFPIRFHNQHGICDDIRNDIRNLDNKIDQQMQTTETTSGLNYSPVDLIKAANEGGNTNHGYSHLKFYDKGHDLKISYINEKGSNDYTSKSSVKKSLREKGVEDISAETIAEGLIQILNTDEKVAEFLERLSLIDSHELKEFLKKELE